MSAAKTMSADLWWRCALHGLVTTGDCSGCDDDLDSLSASSPVLHEQPASGALVAAGEDKLPTIDPQSLDATRPVDLDVCPVCEGDGGISWVSNDPYPGATDGDVCWLCGGTGVRGAA